MARVPGTESPSNRAGLRPGAFVRCRRSRANAALGVADRCGLVAEVRPGHARVLLDGLAAGTWLGNEALLPAEAPDDAELALLGRALVLLGAERIERDEDDLLLIGGEVGAEALDELRALLGPRLLHCSVRPEGVHEIATRLRLAPADS